VKEEYKVRKGPCLECLFDGGSVFVHGLKSHIEQENGILTLSRVRVKSSMFTVTMASLALISSFRDMFDCLETVGEII
jgi:hypothetical protein